jgi:hypothetical protein
MPAMRRIHVLERHNFQLDLNQPEDAYHTNIRRNLQKGLVHDFRLEEISAETYMVLKFAGPEKVQADRNYLMQLFASLVGMGRAEILGLYLEGRIHAAAVLSWSETRVIYMNGTTSEAGKESRAMFVLMDRLIQRGRQKACIFDFEGSNIPGVARFFEGFGGRRTLYPRIILRRFPFLLKIT